MGRLTVVMVVLALARGLAAPPGPIWRPAPEYLALFAPDGPRRAAYAAYVSSHPLQDVLRQLEERPALLRSPGAWEPRRQLAADAFGQTGRYDRWRLAALYGALRPLVARGPASTATGPEEAWTLVSPYPDPALQRLETGTLLLVLSLGAP